MILKTLDHHFFFLFIKRKETNVRNTAGYNSHLASETHGADHGVTTGRKGVMREFSSVAENDRKNNFLFERLQKSKDIPPLRLLLHRGEKMFNE